MTSDEVRIGEAVAALRARLEAGPVENPAAFAHEYVTDMLRQGWRPRALAVETPSYVSPHADPTTRADALAVCRANVAAARQAATAAATPTEETTP